MIDRTHLCLAVSFVCLLPASCKTVTEVDLIPEVHHAVTERESLAAEIYGQLEAYPRVQLKWQKDDMELVRLASLNPSLVGIAGIDHSPSSISDSTGFYDREMPVGTFFVHENGVLLSRTLLRPITDQGPIPAGVDIPLTWVSNQHLLTHVNSLEKDTTQDDPRFFFRTTQYLRAENGKAQSALFDTNIRVGMRYNPVHDAYIYSISSQLAARTHYQSEPKQRAFEFQNIFPKDGHAFYPPKGNKKWSWIVYQAIDGKLYRIPQNHSNAWNDLNVDLHPQGFVLYAADADYNPIVLLKNTDGQRIYGSLCSWSFDFHFYLDETSVSQKLSKKLPVTVNYDITSISSERAQEILSKTELSPIVFHKQNDNPIWGDGDLSDFEPSDAHFEPGNNYFWYSNQGSEFTSWDRTVGYRSQGSLHIHQDRSGTASWKSLNLGPVYYPPRKLKGRYRISARVKTRNLVGTIRIGWHPYVPPTIKATVPDEYSESLSGNNDWVLLELETQNVEPAFLASISFTQEGSGESWIDDVMFERIE